jgi:DeoR/GlpR family transcriptional regulator of sugar metabolism
VSPPPLLTVERHRRIVEAVSRKSSQRVSELAGQFGVTEETIRRDLERLQDQGYLVRSHGGAVALTGETYEVHHEARESRQRAEKTAIAREALKRILPEDNIIMDSSSTVLLLARILPDIRLTVITNSMQTAMELSGRPLIRVIGIGGTLMSSSLSFVGPLAEKCLADYHVRKAFLSCQGFSVRDGASESNELQALLKARMVEHADERYLLVDGSKVGKKSLSVWAQAGDFTEVITDAGADRGALEGLGKAGARLVRAG